MTPPAGVTRVYYFSQAEGADEVFMFGATLIVTDIDANGQTDLVIAAGSTYENDVDVGCIYLLLGPQPSAMIVNLNYDLKICGTKSGRGVGGDAVTLPDITGDGLPDLAFTLWPAGLDCAVMKVFDGSARGHHTDIESFATIVNDMDCDPEHSANIETVASLGEVISLAVSYYEKEDQRQIGLVDARIRQGTSSLSDLVISTISSPDGSYKFGTSLTSGYDLNGDGYQDIWLSDPLAYVDQKGEIYTFLGPLTTDTTIADADYTFRGEYSSTICDITPPFPGCYTDGNNIGSTFVVDGDYNGDGQIDMAITAIQPWDVAWIVQASFSKDEFLKTADFELDIDSPVDLWYTAIAVSDVNGDGSDELMLFDAFNHQLKIWRTPFATAPTWSDLCTVRGFPSDDTFGFDLWKGGDDHYFIYATGTPDRIYEFTHDQLKARIECPSDPSDVKISP